MDGVTRRELLALVALVPLSPAAACEAGPGADGQGTDRRGTDGRLRSRPGRPSRRTDPGLHQLGLGGDRDGLLYAPAGCLAEERCALLVWLHGADNRARVSETMQRLADEFRVIILAPDSRGRTWDVVLGGFGADVEFLDRALAHTFAACAVDGRRVAIGGFSDGASYALSLGPVNGDLFSAIVALSPGFRVAGARRGFPRIFISHGARDQILPVEQCSRRLVPELREEAYRVTYEEFDGPHTVPPAIARKAFEWLAK